MRESLPVLRRSLLDSWRSLLGWALGITAALLMYLPLFPSIGGNGEMQQIIESLPAELVRTLGYEQIATGSGYTQGTFYGLIGFLLLVIAATSWGSAAIAGAEESGQLELALAHAVGRTRYALESALSIALRLVLLGAFGGAVVLALNGPSELGLDPANVVAATAALVGLTLLSASVALAAGALSGRRVIGIAAGAGVAVLGYALNAVANQSTDAQGLRALSPYAWAYAESPLSQGADWSGLALLWGASAGAVAIAVLALRRRDITG